MGTLQELGIPAYWAEGMPAFDAEAHRLVVEGLVEEPRELSMSALRELGTDRVSCRLTSVTRWSVRLAWDGILFTRLLSLVRPLPAAAFVAFESYGGQYRTTTRLEDLAHPRALLALRAEGEPLPVEYGGPVRAVFPQLWGYKSAKSVVRIALESSCGPGYWESRGYAGTGEIAPTKLHDLNTRTTRNHEGGEVPW